MKNRAITWIILAATTIGLSVYNFTDALPKQIDKTYKIRDIEKPLYITIHHTAGSRDQSLESIANSHIERGFPEIAYHFAVNQHGEVYIINDIEEISWHDSGQNTNSIAVVVIGNYEEYILNDKAIKSVELITEILCKDLNIIGIRAHRDTSPTLCCGKYAYRDLKHIFF